METPKTGNHWSDCAQHNEPAYPNGPCDCGSNAPAHAEAQPLDPAASHMEHCRTLVGAQPDETLADAIERLMARQKHLAVDQTMEVVDEWLQTHGDDIGLSSAERDLRERLNKLLKTNERE